MFKYWWRLLGDGHTAPPFIDTFCDPKCAQAPGNPTSSPMFSQVYHQGLSWRAWQLHALLHRHCGSRYALAETTRHTRPLLFLPPPAPFYVVSPRRGRPCHCHSAVQPIPPDAASRLQPAAPVRHSSPMAIHCHGCSGRFVCHCSDAAGRENGHCSVFLSAGAVGTI